MIELNITEWREVAAILVLEPLRRVAERQVAHEDVGAHERNGREWASHRPEGGAVFVGRKRP